MTDYIERDRLISEIEKSIDVAAQNERFNVAASFLAMQEIVYEAPAADVRPVVRGKWEWDPNGMDWGLGAWRCGACRVKAETWWANDRKYNPMRCSGGRFCGNCGANMREENK